MRLKKIILFLFLISAPLQVQAQADCADVTCYFDTGHDFYMQENYPAAEEWLLKAAEAGSGPAQVRLGFMYGENHFEGVQADPDKAEYWLTQAAEQDADGGKFRLGNFYLHTLKPPDFDKAAYWLKRSADENDDPNAQYDIARLYLSDNLGQPDILQGEKYMVMAAENGIKNAQIELVSFYEDQENYQKALHWAAVLSRSRSGGLYWKNKVSQLKTAVE